MIRVLIVDDSPTLRLLIWSIIDQDQELEVVGQARNGQEAIELCAKHDPDIITMDIRMPKMNGYEAIGHIMEKLPRPILVLTSTKSDIELGISIKATKMGALDILGKPTGMPDEDPKAAELIHNIKIMSGVKVVHRSRWLQKTKDRDEEIPDKSSRTKSPASGKSHPLELVGIGASTGGPPALQVILQELPVDFAVPVVVVQHISSGFIQGMARWLDESIPLRVKVAEDDEVLRKGFVYLAPDDRHLVIKPGPQAYLKKTSDVDKQSPSVDVLFNSLARYFRSRAVGVLLTGIGNDGADGLLKMRTAGCLTIAQDEDTSVVYGMPGEAAALGAAKEVLPLGQIKKRLSSMNHR